MPAKIDDSINNFYYYVILICNAMLYMFVHGIYDIIKIIDMLLLFIYVVYLVRAYGYGYG